MITSLLCACGLGACGTPPTPSATEDALGSIAETQPYEFPDDADPALAALGYVETELLVQPFPGAEQDDLTVLYESVGGTFVEDRAELGLAVVEIPADQLLTSATLLAEDDLIEAVHKNYLVTIERTPDDPQYPNQDHLTQIGATEAWDTTVGSNEIAVAIVDTGVDDSHIDLAGRVAQGWSTINRTTAYSDVNGHGTQVAGVVAAAADNGIGVAGVTWDCPILAVRVADAHGTATVANMASGIQWAAEHGADVINVSFAPLWSNTVIKNQIIQAYYRGSLVCVSAGNQGGVRTAADLPEALFVGAVDAADAIAVFSDQGPFVDLAAPGVGVLTTGMGGAYPEATGTSFAAPIVAGVAALVWSASPTLSAAQVRDILYETATDLGPAGRDQAFGWGLVQAGAAVALAASISPQADTSPPVVSFSSPANNGLVSGKTQVQISATDDEGVVEVALSLDGASVGIDKVAPYKFVINTAKYSSGAHTLSAIATDGAGNTSAPADIQVTFAGSSTGTQNSASSIQFTTPANNASVSGNVTISATISDADGLASVQWKVDGVSVYTAAVAGTASSVSYQWRATQAAKGMHTITLTVTDKKSLKTSAALKLNKV